jgi:hypothetical protein
VAEFTPCIVLGWKRREVAAFHLALEAAPYKAQIALLLE